VGNHRRWRVFYRLKWPLRLPLVDLCRASAADRRSANLASHVQALHSGSEISATPRAPAIGIGLQTARVLFLGRPVQRTVGNWGMKGGRHEDRIWRNGLG
jgi:hypothetical protein